MRVYRIGQRDLHWENSNSHHTFTIVTKENGMNVAEEQEHIQFMVNMTFRVKTEAQVPKEKKKGVEVTHSYDIYADYDSEDASL